MTLPRVVAAEQLDHLAPDDPAAQRSRRDLRRVHRAMGTRSITARGWQALVSGPRAQAPLRILEIGAGDGTLLLGVARALAPAWPQVQLRLLDRQALVSAATLAGYAEVGWTVDAQTTDVLDWATPATGEAQAASTPPWDLVTTALFLHHFESAQLGLLLAAVATRADRFFACEPHRGSLALAGSHLVGALGANAVTREDAVLSVHAGFRAGELGGLWPDPARAWHTRDFRAGLFSQGFSAHRKGAA